MPENPLDPAVRSALEQAATHVFPDQIEGPYHRPVHPDRRDIVEDRAGIALRLGIRLQRPNAGEPLTGVPVEVWQADVDGRYSGFLPIQAEPGDVVTSQTVPTQIVAPDESFLRGLQHTDEQGMCQFDTIYPGWYPSRTVHIHLIAHISANQHVTTQLYFPEDITDAVFARPPYDTRPPRDTKNDTDSIFAEGGAGGVLTMIDTADGMIGALNLELPA